jgi:hypothetical protein
MKKGAPLEERPEFLCPPALAAAVDLSFETWSGVTLEDHGVGGALDQQVADQARVRPAQRVVDLHVVRALAVYSAPWAARRQRHRLKSWAGGLTSRHRYHAIEVSRTRGRTTSCWAAHPM